MTEDSGASPLREPHGWEMPKVVKVRCSVDLVE